MKLSFLKPPFVSSKLEVKGGFFMERVFVYGSLRQGFWNFQNLLKGKVNSIVSAEIKGNLYHLPEGYPAAIEGDGNVKGEVLELVDDDLLARLDSLEGYRGVGQNNLYERKKVNTRLKDGEEISCWVYFYSRGNLQHLKKKGVLITDGDWKKFIKEENVK